MARTAQRTAVRRRRGAHGHWVSSPSATFNVAVVDRVAQYTADHRLFERDALRRAGDGWIGLRLDGRSFHTLTREMTHPFDARFEDAMGAACEALMGDEIGFRCCYVQSDEITLILEPGRDAFARRVEKLLSVPAAVCASAFSLKAGQVAGFDARLLSFDCELDAVAALAERQQDAVKNAVTTLAYWTLRQRENLTGRQAHRRLMALGLCERMELCQQLGDPFNDLPHGRRMGRLLCFDRVLRAGFNPKSGERITASRRVLTWQDPTPDFRCLAAVPGA